MKRYQLPTDFDETALHAGLDPNHRLVVGKKTRLTVTYLDTFDWRLHRAGFVLVDECSRRHRLVLFERGRDPYSIEVRTTPKFAEDLPAGHLAESISSSLGIRALAPVGVGRIERRDGRVEDGDGDIHALVRIEELEILDDMARPVGPTVRTLRVSDPSPFEGFLGSFGAKKTVDHDLAPAAVAHGREPDDYSSKLEISLDHRQSSVSALRTILLDLVTTMQLNAAGTIYDIDTEFLHDFRVACRRTRSAMSQLKGVLPADLVAPFKTEFKWLGDVTGPLRDSDVFLLEMPAYRSMLPGHARPDLAHLEVLIRSRRTLAHRAVVRALKSVRFRRLITGWRETLEESRSPVSPAASRSTADLASRRISKTHSRILKRGLNLGADPPAADLHRLRIDAKKLRYLMEFFWSLYPPREIGARIKELKKLQDILGGFNDMEIQRERLAEFADTLNAAPSVATGCILTLGRLDGYLEERQEGFRHAFHDAFADFSSHPVTAAYRRLFKRKESR
jgi:CHAD domain-containing protein